MSDLALIATMCVVCGTVGWPFAMLVPPRFAWRGLIAPAMGYGVLAVVAPVLYERGVMVAAMARGVAALSLVIGLWLAIAAVRTWRVWPPAERRLAVLAAATAAAATLILIAPRWAGGDQFAVFQGNHWDTHGYLESGIVYAREPFSVVAGATAEQIIRNPLLDSAQVNWRARPSAHMLYGGFTLVMPGQAYRLYYAYLAACLAGCVLVLLFVARNLVPEAPPAVWAGMALVFPLGFWGQYIFDINAWSHIAACGSLLLLTALVVEAAVRPDALDTTVGGGLRGAAAIAVVAAGLVYVYPEALIVFTAGTWPLATLILLWRMARARRVAWRALLPLTGAAGVGLAVLSTPLPQFLLTQLHHSSGAKVDWWRFFQAFFVGRDNAVGPPLAFAADFLGALFGLYFATPPAGAPWPAALALRVAIVLTVGAVLVGLLLVIAGRARTADGRPVPGATRARVAAWTAVWLIMWLLPAYLGLGGNYWPAGKAISYAAPVYMTVLALPMGFVFGSGRVRGLRWLAIGFTAFQVANGIGRIQAATNPLGIHYASPYPSVQGVGLKHVGWDLRGLEPLLNTDTKVLITPMDVWQAHHLMVFLWTRRVPFAPASEIARGFGAYARLGALPPPWTPDVEISSTPDTFVLHYRDGRPDVRVATGKGLD